MRPVEIETGFLKTAEGSALIKVGNTQVLCAATVEDGVPPFMRNSGKGWVTAEYAMLPRATARRTPREVNKGRASGRTHEIQRLIGRSMRAVVDGAALGERTIVVDCDVLQADVDMNVVMTGAGKFVEVQATAEHAAFDDDQMARLIALARTGIAELIEIQKRAIRP